jgi:uncharacterized protein (DUF58 family)
MPILIFISILLVLMFVQSLIYNKLALKHLSADVTFSASIATCGDIITITETLENRKMLPLPWITLKFEASRGLLFLDMTNTQLSDHYYRADLLALKGWEKHNRHIRVCCSRRGYFSFKRLGVSTKDLLLMSNIVSVFPCDSTLTVVPQQINDPEMEILFRLFCGDVVSRRSPISDPFSFAGIREYQSRDSLKTINWNATAKKNELMVNIQNHTYQKEITILLNLMPFTQTRNYSLLEKCISLAVTWAGRAVHDSVPIRLISNSRDILTDGPMNTDYGCSTYHLHQISIELARIDLTREAPLFVPVAERAMQTKRHNTTYVVISSNADLSLQKMLVDKHVNGFSVVWVIPYDSVTQIPHVEQEALPFAIPLEVAYDV